MTIASANGFPAADVRLRARYGQAAAFEGLLSEPPAYGSAVFGEDPAPRSVHDDLDRVRIVPPVFLPERLDLVARLRREPNHEDVDLSCTLGGLPATLPLYVSAFGSTAVAEPDALDALYRQAAALGIPVVVGENVAGVHGLHASKDSGVYRRVAAYLDGLSSASHSSGGVVVQQSTEDANAELWNWVYSQPLFEGLVSSGRLGFELKLGQGAKPGLGGITLIKPDIASSRLARDYLCREVDSGVLRYSVPGTFTREILAGQLRLMRNNYPQCRVWVKLPPGRDIRAAVETAVAAGADAVAVDGAEGGTGLAPRAFLGSVGLPIRECLSRLTGVAGCILASGRMWEGSRILKAMALGARGVGLGRAALLAIDEDRGAGLVHLVESISLELQLLLSALGHYDLSSIGPDDIWCRDDDRPMR